MSSLPYFSSIIALLRKERNERKFSFQKMKVACSRGQEQEEFHKRHPLSTDKGIAGAQNTLGCRQADSTGIHLPDHCKLPLGLWLAVSVLRVLPAPELVEVAREGRSHAAGSTHEEHWNGPTKIIESCCLSTSGLAKRAQQAKYEDCCRMTQN